MLTTLLKANYLERSGDVDSALDLLWAVLSPAMYAGRWDAIDRMLDLVPYNTGPHVLLGLLTITAHVRHSLPSRPAFYMQCVVLWRRGGWDPIELEGLE